MKKKLLSTGMLFVSVLMFSQVKETEIISKSKKGYAELINFKETKIDSEEKSINNFLKKQFKNSENDFIVKYKNSQIQNNLEAQKFQQYYKGIKVEHGIQNIVSENGLVKVINGKFIDIKNLSINQKISENQALEFAKKNIGAKIYIWEKKEDEDYFRKEQNNINKNFFPQGELVIIEKDLFNEDSNLRLAYKFDITALYPYDVIRIYIDAENGDVLHKFSEIETVIGIASTRYSGQRNIETQQISPTQYKLRDYTRGSGIETFNMNNSGSYANATDFIDNDNNWTASEFDNSNKDNAALDAHWGTEKVYDYFLQKHNRNSIDNQGYKLVNYVHANLPQINPNQFTNNDNAFWDGSRMTYGDGTYMFSPLTSIDVVGHEIAHGLNTKTANLVYTYESGAINEGLSDVWGAMIEYFAEPSKQTYLIGEEIKIGGGALRSISSPKNYGQPDTYKGANWFTGSGDNGGVHYNSGVFNHWFYILAEGKTGTNDLGNSYNITGIGKDDAAKIVYRAETVYFTPTTNFLQARDLTIQSAKDLFGANSIQSSKVCQAWFAVGVGNNDCANPLDIVGDKVICSSSVNYTYTITNLPPNSTTNWSYSTNALTKISETNSSITVKPISSSYNGIASITATVNGNPSSKTIWIGKPKINVISNAVGGSYDIYLKSSSTTDDLSYQGITTTSWTKTSGNGQFSGSNYYGQADGSPTMSWTVTGKISASNICGATEITKTYNGYGYGDPCNTFTYSIDLVASNTYSLTQMAPPCNGIAETQSLYANNVECFVYNLQGFEVLKTSTNNINISNLPSGYYIIKIIFNNQVLTKKILK